MTGSDKFQSTYEVFETIQREMVTIIAHCTFHRSVLQDLVLSNVKRESDPSAALQEWRDQSLENIERLRFSDLNKQDKTLANSVYEEATRTASSFWNILTNQLSQDSMDFHTKPLDEAFPSPGLVVDDESVEIDKNAMGNR